MPKGFPTAGHACLSQRVARDDQGGGGGERARPLHRLHRLRVDLERRRQQPASQRHLPRQRRQGQPGRALHHAAAARQPQSARPVEVDGRRTEEKTGGEVLAIAHNGNLSNGRMFPIIESFTGKQIDREYAENRVRWEPLYEVTQIKGDGETHPFLSPNDEFANFETLGQGQPRPHRSRRSPRCWSSNTRARRSRTASRWKPNSASIPTSSAWSAAPTRIPASPPSRRTISSARHRPPSRAPDRATHPFVKTGQGRHHGLGADGVRLCRRVGDGEHARGDLRRHEAPRDLRHHRPAHGRALLRRLGFRAGRRQQPHAGAGSATPKACRWAAT